MSVVDGTTSTSSQAPPIAATAARDHRRHSDGATTEQPSIPMRVSCDSTLGEMAHVRLFAAARDAAGTTRDDVPGDTVGAVLAAANRRYGASFAAVLETSKIWVNGEPAQSEDHVGDADELAVLPPVSGG